MQAVVRRFLRQAQLWTAIGLVLVAGWAFVAWMTLDMAHPLVRLTMPFDTAWPWQTAAAVFVMWAGMMVAMMLPSAAPMILAFDTVEARRRQGRRDGIAGARLRRSLSARLGRLLCCWRRARNGCCRRAGC